MIRSMTAFARVCGTGKEESVCSVEIRSLNHRFFEFSLKAPPGIYPLESRIREVFQEKVRRGKISVSIGLMGQEDERPLGVDEALVQVYLKAAQDLKKKFGLQGELSIHDVLALPRVLSTEKRVEDTDYLWKRLEPVLLQAIKVLVKAKEAEGKVLASDIRSRLDEIAEAVRKVEKLTEGSSKRLYKKLSERVLALVGDAALDSERLHKEVAFLAERADVTEELVRLKSHLVTFKKRLDDKEGGELGRELDFLCQEINRETNTLGSKSQMVEISSEVIFMKKELEKIREQVQNIE